MAQPIRFPATGITPFCAFMDAALSQGALPIEQATLYYGAHAPSLIIYRELAERCAAELPGFQVRCYAEQQPDDRDAQIRPGRIDLNTIMAETQDAEGTAFYLSGPKPMIESFRQELLR